MANERKRHVDDLRGATRLAIEATTGVTTVVHAMHRTIASGPSILGRPLATPARLVTGVVYGSIRGVTRLVGAGIERVLAELSPLLGESVPGPQREAVLAVLNGVLGDYLSATGNPLAARMRFRCDGRELELEPARLREALPTISGKLLVLIHGSSMNDLQWNRRGHDHGAALARDLGLSPIYLQYNSGLHISTNGRSFAALLEELAHAWPVPLDEVILLGHSMGALVARSACHIGEESEHLWRRKLTRLVCLGSPHSGASLERGGSLVDLLLGISSYSAPLARLGRIRSAGVTDLRYGSVLDEDWEGRDRFAHGGAPRHALALPDGVECYAVAGTKAQPGSPSVPLPGDGLVSVDSALGMHARAERTLAFPEAHRWIGYGVGHLDLLSHPDVYTKIRSWLSR